MKKEHYPLQDQETVITWNNKLNDAMVFTFDRRITRRLKELAAMYPGQFELMEKNSGKSVTYRIPKQCLCIQPPNRDNHKKQTVHSRYRGTTFKITEILQIEGDRQ